MGVCNKCCICRCNSQGAVTTILTLPTQSSHAHSPEPGMTSAQLCLCLQIMNALMTRLLQYPGGSPAAKRKLVVDVSGCDGTDVVVSHQHRGVSVASARIRQQADGCRSPDKRCGPAAVALSTGA